MAVYACADLHGHMELYKQIKKFLNPEDKVYFLGDAGDRGPQSWELIKTIYQDEQFIYLKGNHEDMLVQAMHDLLSDNYFGLNYQTLVQNGGFDTFQDWLNINNPDYQINWMKNLNNLPEMLHYVNADGLTIVMTHAGFTPGSARTADIIWDRHHFDDEWPDCFQNIIIVHGHTPIPYMKMGLSDEELNPGAYWYCNNHKVNIDNGTHYTGYTCLLDLDTFEEHIFF